MNDSFRVSYCHETRIIEFPFEDLEFMGDGKLVSSAYSGFLVFRSDPYVVRISKKGFVNIEELISADSEKWSYLMNSYGAVKDLRDIEGGVSCWTVLPEKWDDSPEVGSSFYGVVVHRDAATPSDFYKEGQLGGDLVMSGWTKVVLGNNFAIMGNPQRIHHDAYLSFPIERIQTVESKSIVDMLKDNRIGDLEKSLTIFKLFP